MIDVTPKNLFRVERFFGKCHFINDLNNCGRLLMPNYGVMESTRFSPVPADVSKDKVSAKEIENLNSYMRSVGWPVNGISS